MKKGLLTIGAILALSLSINAQVDTLSEFFTGTPTVYGVTAGGTVSGNNAYGDLQKMQLFDPTHGVAASGTITGVALWVPIKVDAGGSFDVAIWADNNGTPGTTTLATKTITIASVDTTTAGYGLAGTTGFFNVVANFSTPVAIPSNHKFWAGVILPTTAGDTIALVTNGDIIELDAVSNTINLKVSDLELEERRKKLVIPPLKVSNGVLYKYVKLVKDASEGCVTDED